MILTTREITALTGGSNDIGMRQALKLVLSRRTLSDSAIDHLLGNADFPRDIPTFQNEKRRYAIAERLTR
jgi:hypothetical protein